MRKPKFGNAPAIFLLVALVGVAGYFLGWSKTFAIQSIEISAQGNEALVSPLIVPKDLHIGLPIARVSTARIKNDLHALDWIATIRVSRRWFAHDVKISITAHTPIAQYQDSSSSNQSAQTKFFDASGYSFVSPNPPANLPTINFATQDATSKEAIALFLSKTPTDLTAHLMSLAIDSSQNIYLATKLPGYDQLQINWGTPDNLDLKVKVLRQLLTLKENKKITAVDLSSPNDPVVK